MGALKRKKSDVKIAYRKMSTKELESFRRMMADIDEVDAGDGQIPPPTPTSVKIIIHSKPCYCIKHLFYQATMALIESITCNILKLSEISSRHG